MTWLESTDFLGMAHRPNTFSYSELRAGTENFSSTNKLGEGGYGLVYKVIFEAKITCFENYKLGGGYGTDRPGILGHTFGWEGCCCEANFSSL